VEDLLVRFGAPAVLLRAALEGDASVLPAGVIAHLGFLTLVEAIWFGAAVVIGRVRRALGPLAAARRRAS
jgi:hypothetical protein